MRVTNRIEMPDPGPVRSFWLQEALAADPGDPCPPLSSNVACDVVILGGGFAGLWTAIELTARRPGLRVVLLEADICGGGASGRNGGFFTPSWDDLRGLARLFGPDEGIRYAAALADEIGAVGSWLTDHGVDAWFHDEGLLTVRAGDWQETRPLIGESYLDRLGLGERSRRLSVRQARAIADSPRIREAELGEGATVQPARLARGLRRVALERGVHVFEGTKALGYEAGPPVVVRAGGGAVRARHLVITTGAWAASWRPFRTSLGNIADFMVATEPIPDRIANDLGWTTHTGIVDTRELLYYLRRTDDGRIVIGGGATGVVFGGRIGPAATHDRRVAEVAARGLLWLFPQLEGVRFEHAWGGPIDMTASFTPFFRTLPPGNVYAGLGFSGHGLAATKLGGRILASLVLGLRDEWSSMPVVGPPVGLTPPEPLRYPLVRAAAWALESGDRAEEEGRTRSLVHRLFAWGPLANRERLRAPGIR